MAKGNYGVAALGGSGGSGSSGGDSGSSHPSKGNYSRIAGEFAKGGYLPGVLERGGGSSAKGNPIKDIAGAYIPSGNNIATDFRKSLKKKG